MQTQEHGLKYITADNKPKPKMNVIAERNGSEKRAFLSKATVRN